MQQCSLIVLVLMGHCSLFVCQLYEYHFIEEKKTWDEAQEYCRQHYTDLATVHNMTDMMRLRNSTNNPEGIEGWIGLQNETPENRMWHWSMPGVEFNDSEAQWDEGEPNNQGDGEHCAVTALRNGKWKDSRCEMKQKHICYNEGNQMYDLKRDKKTWREAQSYCREHHTDLISGYEQLQKLEKTNDVDDWWIGLFRDSWRWSDGSTSSFRNWNQSFNDKSVSKTCAMTLNNGKWSSDECDKQKPFFCYDDLVILINKPKTWEEALYYCRDNHHDLVSITNLDEQRWVQEKAKMADTLYVWLGLRYTCTLDFWFWISDETVGYKNWDSPDQEDKCDMSGAMEKRGQHKWVKMNDMKEFSFICSRH